MKQVLLLSTVILILTLTSQEANAQNLLWAKSAGGTGDDNSYSISADATGNIYITGYFDYPSITFGNITLTNTLIGSGVIFVVKYDANGNVLWAKSAEGTAAGFDIFADANGNVCVTGSFSSPSLTIGSTTLTNTGGADIFIVKYDTNGNVLWAKSVGGNNNDLGHSISCDASGNVYVIGDFYSSSLTVANTTLTNASNHSDIIVLKYDSNGNVLWAKRVGGTNFDTGTGISVDVNGNVYATGSFYGPLLTAGNTTLNNAGAYDALVMKYDPNGSVLWIKSVGGIGADYGQTICNDAGGNVFVTGSFGSPSLAVSNTTLSNTYFFSDIFVLKYDGNGNALWAKSAGGAGIDVSKDIITDAGGNVYATGNFSNSPISFGGTILTNVGGDDVFVTKYDANGNELWAETAGGSSNDWSQGICIDQGGNIFLTGRFYSSNFSIGNTSLTNTGYGDIFVMKLSAVITGIKINSYSEPLNIFPNPFCTQTTLQSEKQLNNATLTMENCFGATVMELKKINGQIVVIPRDHLTTGLYFIRLSQDNKIITSGKVIIVDE